MGGGGPLSFHTGKKRVGREKEVLKWKERERERVTEGDRNEERKKEMIKGGGRWI